MPPSLYAFLLLFLLGATLRFFNLFTKAHTERLAWIVFSITLPATILISLDRASFAPTAWKLPLAACVVTIPLVLTSWQLSRLLQLPRPTRGGYILAAGCINSVYFAYPVVLATFGDEGLARAILFDLGQTTLTLTLLYAIAVGHGDGPGSIKSSALRFLSAPPFMALSLILLLKLLEWSLPHGLVTLLTPLHLATTPLASLVLGLSISFAALKRTWRLALLGVATRMVGGLLMGFLAAWLLDLSGMARALVILVAAMPSAVTAVIFATETHLDEDLVASIVALSICFGMALLPWLPNIATILFIE